MHKRLLPKVNAFTYGIYYLAIPLSQLNALPLPVNAAGIMSLNTQDYAARKRGASARDLQQWAKDALTAYGIPAEELDLTITLITMPRIFGYAFNPVNFWICQDPKAQTRAIICEVNNTFGETHSYICAHKDHRPITAKDTLTAQKLFHVSPFLKREGHYTFRFDLSDKAVNIQINYHNKSGDKQLVTALTGQLAPMTKPGLRKTFWRHPLVTLKAITLIHWQAVKLVTKGIKYIPRPKQSADTISATDQL